MDDLTTTLQGLSRVHRSIGCYFGYQKGGARLFLVATLFCFLSERYLSAPSSSKVHEDVSPPSKRAEKL